MAKKYLTSLDLSKNQLIQAVLEVLASAPSTPVEGQMYYNSTDQTAYIRLSGSWLDLGQSSGGLTDTDYGDITVSGSGTIMTIDDDAVTYAKIQNIVGNNVLLGNNAGAGGVVSELTAAQVRSILNVEDGATADQSDAEIETAYNNQVSIVPQAEAEAGTATTSRRWTAQRVKQAILANITAEKSYKGGYNAATNTPDLDSSPSGIKLGDVYDVTVAGTFFTEALEVGDTIRAKQDNPTLLSHWVIVQANLNAASIKTQYESNPDTNEFTDAEKTKLANAAEVFTQQIGNGASTTIVVTHSLGRQFVNAQVFETSSPHAQVECDIELDSTTQTSFTFNSAPSSNQYTVVITG